MPPLLDRLLLGACLLSLAACGEAAPPAPADAYGPADAPGRANADAADAGLAEAGPADAAPADAPDADPPGPAGDAGAAGDAASSDAPEAGDGGPLPGPCPPGVLCVSKFPFTYEGNTATLGPSAIDSYACKPQADESGSEQLFRVTLPTGGFLSAAVWDGSNVDVDVHLLTEPKGSACLARGHLHASADVPAGTYWVAVDTFAVGGKPQAGPYRVDIGFLAPSQGPCGMATGVMKRIGDGGQHLAMPATGMMVLEAHLVTQEEPEPYPSTATEELLAHYALSQQATGLVLHREQVWAPLEGGSFYGAGIGSPKLLPVVEEGWYVNMMWTKESRPARGTRMILRLPGKSRAVVVAAGHETGPGNLTRIGGTPEETHYYLGTGHLDVMKLGIATDQTLPFGPRVCTD